MQVRMGRVIGERAAIGGIPVEWPDHVALSPNGADIYVTTRKVVDGYKAVNEVKVLKIGPPEGRETAA
jgi:hypothetical protein